MIKTNTSPPVLSTIMPVKAGEINPPNLDEAFPQPTPVLLISVSYISAFKV